jgi:hypothetical protein
MKSSVLLLVAAFWSFDAVAACSVLSDNRTRCIGAVSRLQINADGSVLVALSGTSQANARCALASGLYWRVPLDHVARSAWLAMLLTASTNASEIEITNPADNTAAGVPCEIHKINNDLR